MVTIVYKGQALLTAPCNVADLVFFENMRVWCEAHKMRKGQTNE